MSFLKAASRSVSSIMAENEALKKEIVRLHVLCEKKDACFREMISDGLRHGSRLAAQHMVERSQYLKGR